MTTRVALMLIAISATSVGCSGGGFVSGRWYNLDATSRDCLVAKSPRLPSDGDAALQDQPPNQLPNQQPDQPIRIYASSDDVEHALSVEPLFRVDCRGRATTGLADTWSFDAELGAWMFRGDAIDASLAATLNGVADQVAAVDSVRWMGRSESSVGSLAGSSAESSAGSSAGLIAGLIAVFVADTVDIPELYDLYRTALSLVRSTGTPGTGLVTRATDDERDLIDEGVDVVVTRAQNTIDYARRNPGRIVAPLTWNQDYVVLAPHGVAIADVEVANIVRNVVRADAREPVAGRRYADCAWADAGSQNSNVSIRERVVFEAGDDVARNIAERIVALALRGDLGGRPFTNITAEGITRLELAARIDSGADAFLIASVRPEVADVCTQARLALVAEWLAPGRIADLGSTREHVIVSTGGIEVFQDAAGMPYVRRAQQ